MTKISQLPQLLDSNLGPDMFFPVVAGSTTQKMTTEQLRNLCISGFRFPAHSSLTEADYGKIVVNSGGQAKVATTGGGTAGNPGQWEIKENMLFTRPTAAIWRATLASQANDGDKVSVFGYTFTFVSGTPASEYEIEISTAGYAGTAINMANVLNTFGIDTGNFTATYLGSGMVDITAGAPFIGTAGNNSAHFSTAMTQLTAFLKSSGENKDLDQLGLIILQWEKEEEMYQFTLAQACNASAPAGTLLAGYRWPNSPAEQLQNILYGLLQSTDFTDFFTGTNPSGSVLVIENEAPINEETSFSSETSHTTTTVLDASELGLPDYVQDVVLGQLMYIDQGDALIASDRIIRVRLSPDADPVIFNSTVPADPGQRILAYVNDGMVAGAVNFDSPSLPDGYFANGFVVALEEGNPGDEIWAQTIFIVGS